MLFAAFLTKERLKHMFSAWFWTIQGAVTLGILWGVMVLGVYMTYKVLNYADLTVDGSFTLGGAMSAVYVASGMQPLLAVFLATIGGMIAGTCDRRSSYKILKFLICWQVFCASSVYIQ